MRLDLVVGPNGAGKSTCVRLTLGPVRPGVAFVNADEIAAWCWPDDPEAHSCEAARIDAATVYDNSQRKGPREVALFSHNFPIGNPSWPIWAPDALTMRA